MFRINRWGITAVAVLELAAPLAASAGGGYGGDRDRDRDRRGRMLFATDSGGNLLRFGARQPQNVRSQHITELPAGVAVRGIDFRPATGDLYALGSDRVVYRVNPHTALAVAEDPTFDTSPASVLKGSSFGFDFNPTVDKIRVTSDADENLRLNPDEGNVLAVDGKLNPEGVTVVGSAYVNASFSAARPRLHRGGRPEALPGGERHRGTR